MINLTKYLYNIIQKMQSPICDKSLSSDLQIMLSYINDLELYESTPIIIENIYKHIHNIYVDIFIYYTAHNILT